VDTAATPIATTGICLCSQQKAAYAVARADLNDNLHHYAVLDAGPGLRAGAKPDSAARSADLFEVNIRGGPAQGHDRPNASALKAVAGTPLLSER